jgi:hypothetical protein
MIWLQAKGSSSRGRRPPIARHAQSREVSSRSRPVWLPENDYGEEGDVGHMHVSAPLKGGGIEAAHHRLNQGRAISECSTPKRAMRRIDQRGRQRIVNRPAAVNERQWPIRCKFRRVAEEYREAQPEAPHHSEAGPCVDKAKNPYDATVGAWLRLCGDRHGTSSAASRGNGRFRFGSDRLRSECDWHSLCLRQGL